LTGPCGFSQSDGAWQPLLVALIGGGNTEIPKGTNSMQPELALGRHVVELHGLGKAGGRLRSSAVQLHEQVKCAGI